MVLGLAMHSKGCGSGECGVGLQEWGLQSRFSHLGSALSELST